MGHHLSRPIADMGFFELRRQLEYKATMRGGQVLRQFKDLFLLLAQDGYAAAVGA